MQKVSSFLVFATRILSEFQRRFFLSNRSRVKLVSSVEFNNEEFIDRITITKGSHFSFFNPNLGRVEGKFFEPKELVSMVNAVIELKTGLIADSRNRIVAKSSAWPVEYLLMSRVPILKVSKFLGKTLPKEESALVLPSQSYYHWLIEGLPNFILAREHGQFSKIVVKSSHPSYVEDYIDYMKTSVYRVPEFIRASKVVFVSCADSAGWINPEDVKVLKNHFSEILSKDSAAMNRKIYVSRVKSSRSPNFERKLEELLINKGWEVIRAEEMSLLSQIRLFSEASHIMGIHGAGLSNAIWHQKGIQLIELRTGYSPNCFARLAKAVGLDYLPIQLDERNLKSFEIPAKLKILFG